MCSGSGKAGCPLSYPGLLQKEMWGGQHRRWRPLASRQSRALLLEEITQILSQKWERGKDRTSKTASGTSTGSKSLGNNLRGHGDIFLRAMARYCREGDLLMRVIVKRWFREEPWEYLVDWKRITDPRSFIYLGIINKCLPQATYIYVKIRNLIVEGNTKSVRKIMKPYTRKKSIG